MTQPVVTSPVAPARGDIEASSSQSDEVIAAVRAASGPVPQLELAYEPDLRLFWVTLRPEPKPVFTLPIITSVQKVQHSIIKIWQGSNNCPIRFFAYRGTGPLFSLGGDLDYYLDCLARNDRKGLVEYAARATEVIMFNSNGLNSIAVTLATVHAKALGGGIDPARACNVMIGEEQATFGYPEINYNHFPIAAVPILSRHTGPIEAERIRCLEPNTRPAHFLSAGPLTKSLRMAAVRRPSATTQSVACPRIRRGSHFLRHSIAGLARSATISSRQPRRGSITSSTCAQSKSRSFNASPMRRSACWRGSNSFLIPNQISQAPALVVNEPETANPSVFLCAGGHSISLSDPVHGRSNRNCSRDQAGQWFRTHQHLS